MALTLGNLAAVVPDSVVVGDSMRKITGVTVDSRQAGPGILFVAVRGTHADGHQFALEAVGKGCAAIAVNASFAADLPDSATVLRCPDTRALPALAAQALHGHPDRALWTVAITGTNGKTTTAFLVQAMLGALHGPCGLLGTIHYDDGRRRVPAPLTTPGGPEFYARLADMVAHGCRGVAMELSSHALVQERTAGLGLDVAVMTNLGRDHLDYHTDMADYLRAKALVMGYLRPAETAGADGGGVLALNIADPALATLKLQGCRVIRFAAEPGFAGEAELKVAAADLSLRGTRLALVWQGREIELASPLVGRFNVENLTAALAAGLGLGLDADACAAALAEVAQVPGRLERIDLPNGAIAVVDYAHTHDALAAVLATCDELGAGRLLVVFGCGGDRDRGKRPLMGAVAARQSDLAWITSDNPRTEDPTAICAAVAAGYDAVAAPRARGRTVVEDRAEAVAAALAAAGPGDIVVIAGKGHEDYQLVGDQVLALDDRKLVAEWVAARAAVEGDAP